MHLWEGGGGAGYLAPFYCGHRESCQQLADLRRTEAESTSAGASSAPSLPVAPTPFPPLVAPLPNVPQLIALPPVAPPLNELSAMHDENSNLIGAVFYTALGTLSRVVSPTALGVIVVDRFCALLMVALKSSGVAEMMERSDLVSKLIHAAVALQGQDEPLDGAAAALTSAHSVSAALERAFRLGTASRAELIMLVECTRGFQKCHCHPHHKPTSPRLVPHRVAIALEGTRAPARGLSSAPPTPSAGQRRARGPRW